jgi:primosomal protein N' (replication factor Y)
MQKWLDVAVSAPAHSQVGGLLTYVTELPASVGQLVRVPFGNREVLGVVWGVHTTAPQTLSTHTLRQVIAVLEAVAPLSAHWLQLVQFTAHYYQRSLGEVAMAALPPQLRDLTPVQLARRFKKQVTPPETLATALQSPWPLSEQQAEVLSQMAEASGPFLLHGATGSGKTEVYLQAVARCLAEDPNAQALMMVPEINLTPQLEARVKARFGDAGVVSMHSGMTGPQRLKSWLAAHQGSARIVLGTRMSIFASMPHLKWIVVDEEHDASYKQQEGARYSARDLAIYRARLEGAKVILGSATPSLESWHHCRPAAEGGRYVRLPMPARIGAGQLPFVRRVDMNHQPRKTVLSAPLMAAIQERVAKGEQSMLLLNRRGYAPVLHCADCGWKSECAHCSAFRVFHKIDRTLRCHHCGFTERVPRACPACGNADIAPMGRGTEQLEEHLAELLVDVKRPNGDPVKVMRIDADSTKLKGSLEAQLAGVHSGEVDVLVGTQMIAKGHDFRRITLVAAINPDGALFSSDFRAPERLFALLMQAGGRAGRDAEQSASSEMWLQTFHPSHPLFEALKKHDYPAFAEQQLKERLEAGLPPSTFQALIRSDARAQSVAQAFLNHANAQLQSLEGLGTQDASALAEVSVYPAVPMSIQRVANVERAQMLIESASRKALHRGLELLQEQLHASRSEPQHKGLIRWLVDVDPLAI